MARPKEFDREEALGRALDLFWEKGYEATSIQDLVERTGVQRQSLYDTFGDKHALYLAALQRYAEGADAWASRIAKPPASPLAHLKETFMGVAEESAESCRGCMVMNAAAELGGQDRAVDACVQTNLAKMEQGVATLIRLAQKAGEVPKRVSPTGAARTLVTLLWGMRAMAKSHPDRGWLRSVVEHAVGSLATQS